DRFFIRTMLGYPGEQEELQIVREQRHGHPIDDLQPVVTIQDLAELRVAAESVYLDELLEQWIVQLVRQTRELPGVDVGASVRGSLALAKTARAWALLHERDHVLPGDVERLFVPVLGHRLVLSPTFVADTRHLSGERALEQLRDMCFERVPPPRPQWAIPADAS